MKIEGAVTAMISEYPFNHQLVNMRYCNWGCAAKMGRIFTPLINELPRGPWFRVDQTNNPDCMLKLQAPSKRVGDHTGSVTVLSKSTSLF